MSSYCVFFSFEFTLDHNIVLLTYKLTTCLSSWFGIMALLYKTQGEPRDAAISFDTTPSCGFTGTARVSTFLYRPTSAIIRNSNAEIAHSNADFHNCDAKSRFTAIAENHGTRPKSRGKNHGDR